MLLEISLLSIRMDLPEILYSLACSFVICLKHLSKRFSLLCLLAVAIDALITTEKTALYTFVFVSAFNYCVRQHVSAVKEKGYIAQGKQQHHQCAVVRHLVILPVFFHILHILILFMIYILMR